MEVNFFVDYELYINTANNLEKINDIFGHLNPEARAVLCDTCNTQ